MSAKSPPRLARSPESAYQESILATIERNQIFGARLLLTVFYFIHILYAPAQPITSKFIHLQYRSGFSNGLPVYDIGFDDIYFVLNGVVTLTFLRPFLMQWCFGVIASYFNIHSRKAKVRFAEQGWLLFYYSLSLFYGIYLYYQSPYWLNMDPVYSQWPHNQLTGPFKTYYLISIAFWIQQVVVLNIEEKRKDHFQMFSHHIITCALMFGSYYYYYTRIGHLILMIMDSVDIFLSSAKMLKYAGFSTACDVMFILFLGAWVILRHGLYNYLFFYTYSITDRIWEEGKCVAGVNQIRCLGPNVIGVFLSLLGGLQILMMVWMYLIIKVAYKVITGTGAEDVRSDEDDTDFEDEHDDKNEDDDLTTDEVSL